MTSSLWIQLLAIMVARRTIWKDFSEKIRAGVAIICPNLFYLAGISLALKLESLRDRDEAGRQKEADGEMKTS